MMHRYLNILPLLSVLMFALCADYDLLDEEKQTIDRVELTVEETTDSSVTLSWSRYMDDDFGNYVVLYGTNDIVDWNDKVADSLMFDFDTVKIVQPLDDLTQYYFRVMVLNDENVYSGSNTVKTTTPENMHGKLKLEYTGTEDDDREGIRWTESIDEYDRYEIYADTIGTIDTTDTLVKSVYSDTTTEINRDLFARSFWIKVYAFLDTAIVAKSNTVELRKE